jgi:hypothetical protein
MKKYIAFLVIVTYIFYNVFSIAFAVNTDEKSSPWTREKALHLAEIALFNSSKDIVDALYAA